MADAIAQGKTAGVYRDKSRGRAVVTGGAGTAARVVELFGGMWSWAEKRDLVTGPSPTRGVETARGEAKDRVLSPEELGALGKALEKPDGSRCLIALTGLRREEACGREWAKADAAGCCLRLVETKTGRSMRPIGQAARDLLAGLPRREGSVWVFPNRAGTGSAELKSEIASIFDAAGADRCPQP